MSVGKKLDSWFHQRRWLKKVDVCPPFSTDWKWVHYALEPLFSEQIDIDGFNLYWDFDAWCCEIHILNEELSTTIIKHSETPLGAIILASGELIGQLIGAPDEPKTQKRKKKKSKKPRRSR